MQGLFWAVSILASKQGNGESLDSASKTASKMLEAHSQPCFGIQYLRVDLCTAEVMGASLLSLLLSCWKIGSLQEEHMSRIYYQFKFYCKCS